MKILPFRSTTIDKYRDDLATALGRKSGNRTISNESFEKLAYIANERFGFGLGGVFTGPLGSAPVLRSHSCQLQIERLRNLLTDQRLQFREGTCLDTHLRDVLDRLPQLQPRTNQREMQAAHGQNFSGGAGKPSQVMPREPKPDYHRVTFGPGQVKLFHDHPDEVRTSYEAKSAAAQLIQFMEDGLGIGYSEGECARLWDAAMNVAHLKSDAEVMVEKTIRRAARKGEDGELPPIEMLAKLIRRHGGVERLTPRDH